MSQGVAEETIYRDAVRLLPELFGRWTGESLRPAAIEEVPSRHDKDRIDLLLKVGSTPFLVEVTGSAGISQLDRAIEQVRKREALQTEAKDACALLVVPYMTQVGKERLAKENVSWVDLSGNASVHIDAPFPLHVHVEGRPNQYQRRGRPKNLFAPKASRLTRYLLLHPKCAFSQRELSDATGVGEGYVSRLVRQLEDEALLVRDEAGKVRPRNCDLLLDAWAEGNEYRHERLRGHVSARSGDALARKLSLALGDGGVEHAATGLASAWAYTNAASFRTASFYVERKPPEDLLNEIAFREESGAPNTVLMLPDDAGVFEGARETGEFRCVAPVQTYVDLQHEGERAEELAEALRSRHLEWASSDPTTRHD